MENSSLQYDMMVCCMFADCLMETPRNSSLSELLANPSGSSAPLKRRWGKGRDAGPRLSGWPERGAGGWKIRPEAPAGTGTVSSQPVARSRSPDWDDSELSGRSSPHPSWPWNGSCPPYPHHPAAAGPPPPRLAPAAGFLVYCSPFKLLARVVGVVGLSPGHKLWTSR
jgi:hypothetical protein